MAGPMFSQELLEIFNESQKSKTSHGRLTKVLLKHYNEMGYDEFWPPFQTLIQIACREYERAPPIERLVAFIVKFVLQTNETPESDVDGNEDELGKLMTSLIKFCLRWNDAFGYSVRHRCVQIVSLLLEGMAGDAMISDDLFSSIQEMLLNRIWDVKPFIRAAATRALARLQDPTDRDCPVVTAFLYLLRHDANPDVRRAGIQSIAITTRSLPEVLNRSRDVADIVRRAVFEVIVDKISIRPLTIAKRIKVLKDGMNDRSCVVKDFVAKRLLPSWLSTLGSSPVSLLKALDVEGSPEVCEKACIVILDNAKKANELHDLISSFVEEYLDHESIVPDMNKLCCESAFFWRVLIEYLKRLGQSPESDRLLELCLPLGNALCLFLRTLLDRHKETPASELEARLVNEFIASQIISLAKSVDLSDEFGRKALKDFVRDCLISPSSYVCHGLVAVLLDLLMKLNPHLEDSNLSIEVVEMISEIREPMLEGVTEKTVNGSDDSTGKMNGKVEMRLEEIEASLRAAKEELQGCISRMDFESAAPIRDRMKSLELEKGRLVSMNTNGVEGEDEEKADDEDEETQLLSDVSTLIKANTVAVELLKRLHKLDTLTPSLRTLVTSLILPSISNADPWVRNLAVTGLGLICILDRDLAKKYLPLFGQISRVDHTRIRVSALKSLFDCLLVFGLDTYKGVNFEDPTRQQSKEPADDKNATPAAEGDAGGAESKGDEAESGATLTKSGSRTSLLSFIIDYLDSEDAEVRTVCVEGLVRLLYLGLVTSSSLLSRLVLLWFNPVTEEDTTLRHCLAVFLPAYCFSKAEHQGFMLDAVLPTLKALFTSSESSPLAKVDVWNVASLLLHLTDASNLVQKSSVESDATVTPSEQAADAAENNELPEKENVLSTGQPGPTKARALSKLQNQGLSNPCHDRLAITLSEALLHRAGPDATRIYVRMLTNLRMTADNVPIRKELYTLLHSVLQKNFLDKMQVRAMQKLQYSVTTALLEAGEDLVALTAHAEFMNSRKADPNDLRDRRMATLLAEEKKRQKQNQGAISRSQYASDDEPRLLENTDSASSGAVDPGGNRRTSLTRSMSSSTATMERTYLGTKLKERGNNVLHRLSSSFVDDGEAGDDVFSNHESSEEAVKEMEDDDKLSSSLAEDTSSPSERPATEHSDLQPNPQLPPPSDSLGRAITALDDARRTARGSVKRTLKDSIFDSSITRQMPAAKKMRIETSLSAEKETRNPSEEEEQIQMSLLEQRNINRETGEDQAETPSPQATRKMEETAQTSSLQPTRKKEEETAQTSSPRVTRKKKEETAQTSSLQPTRKKEEETAQTSSPQPTRKKKEETAQTSSLQPTRKKEEETAQTSSPQATRKKKKETAQTSSPQPTRKKKEETTQTLSPQATRKKEETAQTLSPQATRKKEETAQASSPQPTRKKEEETAQTSSPQPTRKKKEETAQTPSPRATRKTKEETAQASSPRPTRKKEEETAQTLSPQPTRKKKEETAQTSSPRLTRKKDDETTQTSSPRLTRKKKEETAQASSPQATRKKGEETARTSSPRPTRKKEETAQTSSPQSIRKTKEETAQASSPQATRKKGEETARTSSPRPTRKKEETAQASSPRATRKKKEETAQASSPQATRKKGEETARTSSPRPTRKKEETAQASSPRATRKKEEETAHTSSPRPTRKKEETAQASSPRPTRKEEETAHTSSPQATRTKEEETAQASSPRVTRKMKEATAQILSPRPTRKKEEETAQTSSPRVTRKKKEETAEASSPKPTMKTKEKEPAQVSSPQPTRKREEQSAQILIPRLTRKKKEETAEASSPQPIRKTKEKEPAQASSPRATRKTKEETAETSSSRATRKTKEENIEVSRTQPARKTKDENIEVSRTQIARKTNEDIVEVSRTQPARKTKEENVEVSRTQPARKTKEENVEVSRTQPGRKGMEEKDEVSKAQPGRKTKEENVEVSRAQPGKKKKEENVEVSRAQPASKTKEENVEVSRTQPGKKNKEKKTEFRSPQSTRNTKEEMPQVSRAQTSRKTKEDDSQRITRLTRKRKFEDSVSGGAVPSKTRRQEVPAIMSQPSYESSSEDELKISKYQLSTRAQSNNESRCAVSRGTKETTSDICLRVKEAGNAKPVRAKLLPSGPTETEGFRIQMVKPKVEPISRAQGRKGLANRRRLASEARTNESNVEIVIPELPTLKKVKRENIKKHPSIKLEIREEPTNVQAVASHLGKTTKKPEKRRSSPGLGRQRFSESEDNVLTQSDESTLTRMKSRNRRTSESKYNDEVVPKSHTSISKQKQNWSVSKSTRQKLNRLSKTLETRMNEKYLSRNTRRTRSKTIEAEHQSVDSKSFQR